MADHATSPQRPPVPHTPRERLLRSAIAAITGPRQEIYGSPGESFAIVASLWTVYLRAIAWRDLRPHDVAVLLGLMKTARIATSKGTHRDSWVDMAGYAACGAECAQSSPWMRRRKEATKMLYGFFSEKAAQRTGSFLYEDANGRDVEVTAVYPSMDQSSAYGWDDKVCVGEVRRYLRAGRNVKRSCTPLHQPYSNQVPADVIAEFKGLINGYGL